MKNYFWYLIEIDNEKVTAFEKYILTITRGLQFTAYKFTVYKAVALNYKTTTYYINEEIQYLQSLIKHRYPQIVLCNEPKSAEIVKVDFL